MPILETPITSSNGKTSSLSEYKKYKQKDEKPKEWSNLEKNSFRFFFIYFFLQAFPLDWKFYKQLFTINWLNPEFKGLFELAKYAPKIIEGPDSFINWGILAIIAMAGTVVWNGFDKGTKEYNKLYYYLRVLLRYRLAAGVIAFGLIKFFPMQMPYPSISSLNTSYGDLSAWRIFSMSTGIVPGYQSFLGLIELFSAILLLNRKTFFVGAFILFAFLTNAFISNLAYEGGEYVYSLLLVSISGFLLAYDAPRLLSLTTFEKLTQPARFKPVFEGITANIRIGLKAIFVFIYIFVFGYKSYSSYKNNEYQFPKEPGLANAAGLYNVSEFRINNKVYPYSPFNTERWKDVVFEKWATVSIRTGKKPEVFTANTEEIFTKDADKNYEYAGTSGRAYFSYKIDSSDQVLILENRNPIYKNDKLILYYSRPDSNRIILQGLNENKDSVYAVLEKVNKKYLLKEAEKTGRRKALKL